MTDKCRFSRKIEQLFDGAGGDTEALHAHRANCRVCSALWSELESLRTAAASVRTEEGIEDHQMASFTAGIRSRIEQEAPRHTATWAIASVAVVLIIAILPSIFLWENTGTDTARTYIESCSTDLQGATAFTSYDENGIVTVWVSDTKGDNG